MIAKAKSHTPYIPSWMIESGFNHYQLAILTYVACRGKCFETKKTVWTKLGMGEKQYRRSIKELTQAGWIKQTWVTRKRCLEVTKEGKHMDFLKSEKQSDDCIKERSNDRIKKQSIDCAKKQSDDCTNIPSQLTKVINQGNKPSTNQVPAVPTKDGKEQGTSMTGKPLHCSQEDYDSLVGCIWEAGRARRVTR